MPGIGFRPCYYVCSACQRVTATTGDAVTGARYFRAHGPKADRCPKSNKYVGRHLVEVQPPPSRRELRAAALERRLAR